MDRSGPRDPRVEKIADGVWAIRVPISDHPLRASFAYVYAEDGTAAVIDPGWPTEPSWEGLTAGLAEIGLRPVDVASILLTHAHRDHSGLAGRLAAVSGAEVLLHGDDLPLLPAAPDVHRARVSRWLQRVGAPPDSSDATAGRDLPQIPEPLSIDRYLEDGETIEVPGGRLHVHWTPGHTPGHVCFEDPDRRILFAGDHLLPRITPNISVMVGHKETALGDYLRSLNRVARLDVDRVMPGHEYSFGPPRPRATALLEHHRRRLEEILTVLRERPGATTYEVAEALTWSRPWTQISGLQRRSAIGEVLSHLCCLEASAAVVSQRDAMRVAWTVGDGSVADLVRIAAAATAER